MKAIKLLLTVISLSIGANALAWHSMNYTCENFTFSIGNYPGTEDGELRDTKGNKIRRSIYNFDFENSAINFKARNSKNGPIAASTVYCTEVCESISSVEPVCEKIR